MSSIHRGCLAIKYNIGQALEYWTAGGTAGAKWIELAFIAPVFAAGMIGAIIILLADTIGRTVSFGAYVPTGVIITVLFD
ncbi:hypothetical protein J4772_05780 [Cohnella sp. LGH]|uniref:hypothetical protein n=1 Tax=Cohnella sp. LGH TaxID=1619153 RepID=UPI001ADD2DE2|nr:hypothetical protein [Cohnella sp. LGH]QTH43920.1 hypothetical protein J4772_05780 [Cohnella sp. LGH]